MAFLNEHALQESLSIWRCKNLGANYPPLMDLHPNLFVAYATTTDLNGAEFNRVLFDKSNVTMGPDQNLFRFHFMEPYHDGHPLLNLPHSDQKAVMILCIYGIVKSNTRNLPVDGVGTHCLTVFVYDPVISEYIREHHALTIGHVMDSDMLQISKTRPKISVDFFNERRMNSFIDCPVKNDPNMRCIITWYMMARILALCTGEFIMRYDMLQSIMTLFKNSSSEVTQRFTELQARAPEITLIHSDRHLFMYKVHDFFKRLEQDRFSDVIALTESFRKFFIDIFKPIALMPLEYVQYPLCQESLPSTSHFHYAKKAILKDIYERYIQPLADYGPLGPQIYLRERMIPLKEEINDFLASTSISSIIFTGCSVKKSPTPLDTDGYRWLDTNEPLVPLQNDDMYKLCNDYLKKSFGPLPVHVFVRDKKEMNKIHAYTGTVKLKHMKLSGGGQLTVMPYSSKSLFTDLGEVKKLLLPNGYEKIISSATKEAKSIYSSFHSFFHEWFNDDMHYTVIPIDIDIDYSQTIKRAKKTDYYERTKEKPIVKEYFTVVQFRKKFIADLKKIAENCTREICCTPKEEDIKTLVFQSDKKDKLSLRLYISLPTDIAMTREAVCKFVEILENVRHDFPDTIGAPTDSMFDLAIYNGPNKSLRLPFQRKENGTGMLLPADPTTPEIADYFDPINFLAHGGCGRRYVISEIGCNRLVCSKTSRNLADKTAFVTCFNSNEDARRNLLLLLCNESTTEENRINEVVTELLFKKHVVPKISTKTVDPSWLNALKVFVKKDTTDLNSVIFDVHTDKCKISKGVKFCLNRIHQTVHNTFVKLVLVVKISPTKINYILYNNCISSKCQPRQFSGTI